MSEGKLIIGGVDIGNINDISTRLIDSILSADVVIVENLSRFRDKCTDLQISSNAIILEHNSENEDDAIVLQFITRSFYDSKTVLLISSDGMPGICDPGHKVVQLASSMAIAISVIPGPSIVSTLPAISGFRYSSFIFQDSISSNQLVRKRELSIAKESHRAFLFVIPDRKTQAILIPEIISDIESVYGKNIHVAIGVNLTGLDQSIFIGAIDQALKFIHSILVDHSTNISFFIEGSE